MILKAAAVLGGLFVVIIGGVAVTKYGSSIFGKGIGGNSSNAKLYLDENGSCRYEASNNTGNVGGKGIDQPTSSKPSKDDGLCTKILTGKWEEVDLSNVDVYWGSAKAKTKIEEAKEKGNQRNSSSNV